MVNQSVQNAKAPPGGSHHGHTYMTHAFEGFVYPGSDVTRGPSASHTAVELPDSHFRKIFKEASDKIASKPPTIEERLMGRSGSAPSLGAAGRLLQHEWLDASRGTYVNKAFPVATLLRKGAPPPKKEELDVPARQWYPHPSLRRGEISISMPAVLANGVDPAKNKTRICPFYQAERNRLATAQKMPESRPRTPPRAKRWFNEDAWNDSSNHPHLKVTHVAPPEAKSSLPSGLHERYH